MSASAEKLVSDAAQGWHRGDSLMDTQRGQQHDEHRAEQRSPTTWKAGQPFGQ